MKILDKYIIKKYFVTFSLILLLFTPIMIMVDLAERIDKIKENNVPADEVIQYYLDFTVYFGHLLFPIFLFIGVIWFTSKMANNTEVIAVLSSGISFTRYLRPFLISAGVVSLLSLVGGMYLVPSASKGYNEFRYKHLYKYRKDRETSELYKQLNDDDYVYVSSYDPKRQQAFNFTLEHFEENVLKYKISARNIRWVEKDTQYVMVDYIKRTIHPGDDIIETKRRLDTMLPFEIDDLSPVNYMAETLNYNELNEFIEEERKGGSSLLNNHLLVKYKRISLPVSVFILTIIAVAVSSFKRRGGMGVNLAFGLAIGLVFIFFDRIFGVLAQQSGLSPMIAAWLPIVIFGLFAIFLLNNAKR